jgi:hypothetical protein
VGWGEWGGVGGVGLGLLHLVFRVQGLGFRVIHIWIIAGSTCRVGWGGWGGVGGWG